MRSPTPCWSPDASAEVVPTVRSRPDPSASGLDPSRGRGHWQNAARSGDRGLCRPCVGRLEAVKQLSARRVRAFSPLLIGVLAALTTALLPPVPATAAPAAGRTACTINGTPGPDVLRGGPGRDVICGWGGDDVLIGGGGDDVLRGGGGDDVLRGGDGDDLLQGGRGADRLYGGAGDDVLRGYVGDDQLHGEAGGDELRGYRGRDRLDGGPGVDRLFGGPGSDRLIARGDDGAGDRISCGRGEDVVVADSGAQVQGRCQTAPGNRAPTQLRLVPARVAENQPAGTEVGRLQAVDPDSGDAHEFTLVPGAGADDNAAFVLDGDRLLTARPFDFEAAPRLSVRVQATDRGGLSLAASLTVEVTDVAENRAPTAVGDAYATDEDVDLRLPTTGTGGPTANDTDPDGDPLTVVAVDQASGGTVEIAAAEIVFRPEPDRCGTGSAGFRYTVSDGRGGSDSARVDVDLRCLPDPTVVRDDSATVDEDAPATTIDVLANDTDPDGDPVEIDSVTQPAHGTVVVTGGGSALTYRPAANFCSPPVDTFTYTVVDGPTATVSVSVDCVDDAPVAVADTLELTEDDPATAADPLANDTDVDGGPMSIDSVTQPAAGTVAIIGGGADATYEPDADACGPDSFTYTLSPGGSTATVAVEVACVDDAPVGVADTLEIAEDSGWTVVPVLANDTDVDDGPMATTGATGASHGQVDLIAGTISYRPAADYCGSDSFTYTLWPGNTTVPVTVTVTCVDDPPVAVSDSVTTTVDTPVALDVLANDTDVDGGPIAAEVVSGPAHGSLLLDDDGTGTYSPAESYCNTRPGPAPDTFVYRLVPGGATATVSVTVTCSDDPPTAVDDTLLVAEDAPATPVAVLANDTDSDGGPMSVGAVTQPDHGVVVITGGGTGLTYEPAVNYCGPDSFTYTLSPGTSTATVEVTVGCVDDAPVAVDDAVTVEEDAAASALDVLANDTDIDGGPKRVDAVVSGPAHGTVLITGGGSGLTYTPEADYCNDPPGTDPDEFTYKLNGGDTAVVEVTVTCVNDAPVVPTVTLAGPRAAIGNTTLVVDTPTAAYSAVGSPAKAVTVDLLAAATDIDGPGPLAITAATITTDLGGTVDLRADGTFRYDPPGSASCTGTDSFDYTVSDAASPPATTTATVEIAVADCVWYVDNTAPAGGDGTAAAPFDTLAEAETASGADDTVFVYVGDGTSSGLGTGFRMDPRERLLGEAAGLTVSGVALVAPEPGARPLLTASGADVIALDDANVVRGLQIDPAGGGGVAGAAGDTGGGTLADLRIIDTGVAGTGPALGLTDTTGTYAVSDLVVDTSAATSPPATAVGIRLVNAGTVTFADAGTIRLVTKGAKALEVSGTALGSGSVFDAITVTGSSSGAVTMTNATGTTTFAGLDLTTTGGAAAAFALSNAGTVQVPAAATADVDATGGPAVAVIGTGGAVLHFDRVRSTGSATAGIGLSGLGTGVFSAAATSAVSGAAGVAFDLDGGSGDVTYAGSIDDGDGRAVEITGRSGGAVTFSGSVTDAADAGGGIAVSGNTGGSTTFSGAAKQLDTGAEPAVTMQASSGHTLSFTGGGLVIRATSGAGLRAVDGGSIAVTGSGNRIATTTGTALDVSGTAIATAGVTFQSISATGAPVGIRLDDTGTTAGAGSLTVTGDGGSCTTSTRATCSGGEIADAAGGDDTGATPTGTGIVLNRTRAPSLTRMWLHGHANYAIRGTGVVGFTMADSVVDGANGTIPAGPYYDSAIFFDGLTGSASITRTLIQGGAGNNLRVSNGTGTLDRLVLDQVELGLSGATPTNDAVLLQTSGTAGMKVTVKNSSFFSAAGDLLQLDHSGTGPADLVLTGNTFSNGHPAIAEAGGGVTLTQSGGSGVMSATVTGNSFRGAVGNAFTAVKGLGPSVQTGTFQSNTVGVAGGVGSGSLAGSGVKIQSLGEGSSTWAVRSNQIRQYGASGIEILAGGGGIATGGAIDASIADNNITQYDLGNPSAYGIHLNLGTVAGATFSGCAAITGNTVSTGGATTDIRLRQRYSTTLRLPGYAGASADPTAASAFVNANNMGSNAVQVDISSPPGGGVVGGVTCAQPPA